MKKEGITVLSLFDGLSVGQLALKDAGIKVNKYYSSEIDKYVIGITQYNFPNTIQLGDIKKWKEWNIDWKEIDLIFGGFPCFAKGTKIITKTGYKNIEDIKIGEYVYTHKGRYKKVLNTNKKKNKIWKLKSQGTLITETTAEHPYYISKMSRIWNNKRRTYKRVFSNPNWIPVKELKRIEYFTYLPIIKIEENPLNLNKELCWLLGRYVANGFYQDSKRKNRKNSYNYKIIICVGKHKTKEFEENIKTIKYTKSENRTVFKYIFCSMNLLSLVKKLNLGRSAIKKRVPQEILHLPKELAKEFLDGYMSGDGCYSREKYKATSISKELCMGLNLLIAKIYEVNSGIVYCKRPKTTIIESRIVNQRDTYSVDFFTEMKKQTHAVIKDSFVLLPITKIEETNEIKDVYNIEVEEDNSYYANNLCVHNCQAWSKAGKQLGDKDVRGSLMWDMLEIKKHVESLNPKVKFLFENVVMKKEFLAYVNKAIGVQPVKINSSKLSAQHRQRLYWTNIEGKEESDLFQKKIGQPKDKHVYLKDILEKEVDEKYFLSDKMIKCILAGGTKNYNVSGELNPKKSYALLATMSKMHRLGIDTYVCCAMRGRHLENGKRKDIKGSETKQLVEIRNDDKTNCLTTVQKDNLLLEKPIKIGKFEEEKEQLIFEKNKDIINLKKGSTGKSWWFEQQTYHPNSKTRALKSSSGSGNIPKVFQEPKRIGHFNKGGQGDRVYDPKGKSVCLSALGGGRGACTGRYQIKSRIRRLTPRECENLQTVPIDFTAKGIINEKVVDISDSQRYKALGNAWTKDVIVWILSHLRLD